MPLAPLTRRCRGTEPPHRFTNVTVGGSFASARTRPPASTLEPHGCMAHVTTLGCNERADRRRRQWRCLRLTPARRGGKRWWDEADARGARSSTANLHCVPVRLGFGLGGNERSRTCVRPSRWGWGVRLRAGSGTALNLHAKSSRDSHHCGGQPSLTDPRPAAAFTSDAARSLLPVGSLRASRGTVRGARRQTRPLADHCTPLTRLAPANERLRRSLPLRSGCGNCRDCRWRHSCATQAGKWHPHLGETDGIRAAALARTLRRRCSLRCASGPPLPSDSPSPPSWTALGADGCGTAPLALPLPQRGGSSFLRDPSRRQ